MKVAMMQVGPPIRPFWLHIARTLSEGAHEVFFFGPSPAFAALLRREGHSDNIITYDGNGREPLPDVDRRDDIVAFNTEYLGWRRRDLQRRYHDAKQYFDELDIDVAVFWNDIDIEHLAATTGDVATIYMENGYLPDTVQIDTEGVNQNASYAGASYEDILDRDPLWEPLAPYESTIRDIDPLGLFANARALLQTRGIQGNFVWTVCNELQKQITSFRRQFVDSGDSSCPDDYVFVPLQVHDDTQVLYNSPYVDDMYELVDLVVEAVDRSSRDIDVVVKEHPADIGRIEYSDLRQSHDDLIWLKDYAIDEVVQRAQAVVTINSSVGFQALSEHVPVVTLGESFYDNNPFVEHPTAPDGVPDAVERVLDRELDPQSVDTYVDVFAENVFASGGIGDVRSVTVRQVCSAIHNVATRGENHGSS